MSDMITGTLTEAEFLHKELEMGVSLDNPGYLNLMEATVRGVMRHVNEPVASALDLGCGVGALTVALARDGIKTLGIDSSGAHVAYIDKYIGRHPEIEGLAATLQGDFTRMPLPRVDLACCIEVAEHIDDEHLLPFLSKLRDVCDYFLFSSTSKHTTPEQDAAWGHINIKPQETWISLMQHAGFRFIAGLQHPTPWTMLFERV